MSSPSVSVPPELRRLRIISAVFVGIILVGVVGYMLLAQLAVLDALYMTVITISTVGYREVVELDAAGQLLTIFLIVSGVGTVSYAAVTAAEFIVEGHLGRYIGRKRVARDIAELDGHIIVCGLGRVGRELVFELTEAKHDIVVVENDEERIEELVDRGWLHVEGDATEEETLVEAGIERARTVVACVNSDADNVLLTLTAKGLRGDVEVIARTKAEENERKLLRAGADRVIAPAIIGGRRIAQLLTRPAVVDFLERLGGVDYTIDQVTVRSSSELEGRSLRDAQIRERFGVTVIGVSHPGGGLDTHPAPELELGEGDVLVVMGDEDDVEEIRATFEG